jgi:hypothetical protein
MQGRGTHTKPFAVPPKMVDSFCPGSIIPPDLIAGVEAGSREYDGVPVRWWGLSQFQV